MSIFFLLYYNEQDWWKSLNPIKFYIKGKTVKFVYLKTLLRPRNINLQQNHEIRFPIKTDALRTESFFRFSTITRKLKGKFRYYIFKCRKKCQRIQIKSSRDLCFM